MKTATKLSFLFSLALSLVGSLPAADVTITNVTRAAVVPSGSYALGTTGLVTRLLPISLLDVNSATTATNLAGGSLVSTGLVARIEAGSVNTLVVTNGEVGIGTATPDSTRILDITSKPSWYCTIGLNNPSTGYASSVQFRNAGAANWEIGQYVSSVSGCLEFYHPSYGLVMSLDGRNVGIGTDDPGWMVDVLKSSDSGVSTGFPTVHVGNTLVTKGNGVTTFNDAEVKISSGNNTVVGGIWTEYTDLLSGFQVGTATAHPVNIVIQEVPKLTITTSGDVVASQSITATNGVILPATATPPALTVGGAQLWSDGTNLCVIIKDGAGTLTTNKLTMSSWP